MKRTCVSNNLLPAATEDFGAFQTGRDVQGRLNRLRKKHVVSNNLFTFDISKIGKQTSVGPRTSQCPGACAFSFLQLSGIVRAVPVRVPARPGLFETTCFFRCLSNDLLVLRKSAQNKELCQSGHNAVSLSTQCCFGLHTMQCRSPHNAVSVITQFCVTHHKIPVSVGTH